MINIPDKIWYIKSANSNVSYLTYHEESESSAYKKRKETGRSWSRQKSLTEGMLVDNKPKQNFKIIGVSSRSRTDNKVFDIQDTELGIEFEISTYNLLTLIKECKIENGLIVSDVVYYFDNGVGLMSVSGEAYKNYIKDKFQIDNKIPYSALILGDKFVLFKDENEYVYCGRYKLKFTTHPTLTSHSGYRREKSVEVFPPTEVDLGYQDYRLNLTTDTLELCKTSDKVDEIVGKTDYTPDLVTMLVMETPINYDIKYKIRSVTAKTIEKDTVDWNLKFEFLEGTYKPNKMKVIK